MNLKSHIEENLDVPYKNIQVDSDLIILKLSLDSMSDWEYGYWINSRRLLFSMFYENNKLKLKLDDKKSNLPKFRKVSIRSVDDGLLKIQNYIDDYRLYHE